MTKTEFLQLPTHVNKPILDKAYWLCNNGYATGDPINIAIKIFKTQNEQHRREIPSTR